MLSSKFDNIFPFVPLLLKFCLAEILKIIIHLYRCETCFQFAFKFLSPLNALWNVAFVTAEKRTFVYIFKFSINLIKRIIVLETEDWIIYAFGDSTVLTSTFDVYHLFIFWLSPVFLHWSRLFSLSIPFTSFCVQIPPLKIQAKLEISTTNGTCKVACVNL